MMALTNIYTIIKNIRSAALLSNISLLLLLGKSTPLDRIGVTRYIYCATLERLSNYL